MTTWIVTSSVLIVVVLVLRFVLQGKISRRLQYGLWALVLLRLLIPWTLPKSNVSVMYVAEEVHEYLFTQTEPMPVETGDSGTAPPRKAPQLTKAVGSVA